MDLLKIIDPGAIGEIIIPEEQIKISERRQ